MLRRPSGLALAALAAEHNANALLASSLPAAACGCGAHAHVAAAPRPHLRFLPALRGGADYSKWDRLEMTSTSEAEDADCGDAQPPTRVHDSGVDVASSACPDPECGRFDNGQAAVESRDSAVREAGAARAVDAVREAEGHADDEHDAGGHGAEAVPPVRVRGGSGGKNTTCEVQAACDASPRPSPGGDNARSPFGPSDPVQGGADETRRGGVVDICGGGAWLSATAFRVRMCARRARRSCVSLPLPHSAPRVSRGLRRAALPAPALAPSRLATSPLDNPLGPPSRPSPLAPAVAPLRQRTRTQAAERVAAAVRGLLCWVAPPAGVQAYWHWRVRNYWRALELELAFILCPRMSSFVHPCLRARPVLLAICGSDRKTRARLALMHARCSVYGCMRVRQCVCGGCMRGRMHARARARGCLHVGPNVFKTCIDTRQHSRSCRRTAHFLPDARLRYSLPGDLGPSGGSRALYSRAAALLSFWPSGRLPPKWHGARLGQVRRGRRIACSVGALSASWAGGATLEAGCTVLRAWRLLKCVTKAPHHAPSSSPSPLCPCSVACPCAHAPKIMDAGCAGCVRGTNDQVSRVHAALRAHWQKLPWWAIGLASLVCVDDAATFMLEARRVLLSEVPALLLLVFFGMYVYQNPKPHTLNTKPVCIPAYLHRYMGIYTPYIPTYISYMYVTVHVCVCVCAYMYV